MITGVKGGCRWTLFRAPASAMKRFWPGAPLGCTLDLFPPYSSRCIAYGIVSSVTYLATGETDDRLHYTASSKVKCSRIEYEEPLSVSCIEDARVHFPGSTVADAFAERLANLPAGCTAAFTKETSAEGVRSMSNKFAQAACQVVTHLSLETPAGSVDWFPSTLPGR